MRHILISQGEVSKWKKESRSRGEEIISIINHCYVISSLEEKFALKSIEFYENLAILNCENTKFKTNLPKQVQETTKNSKEIAILRHLHEDIIQKDNKILAFRIPTRVYT